MAELMFAYPSTVIRALRSSPGRRIAARWMLLAPLFTIGPAHAQSPKPVPRSTVSGHVLCADTNAPARLAKVTLNKLRNDSDASGSAAPGTTTGLDGEFEIADVPPGRYLVLVELAGYISGISGLDRDAREHLKNVARTPPEGSSVIEVTSGLPVSADLTLERGASVAGTIRYDDGSPAIGVMVSLEHKNSKGAWEPALQSTSQTFDFFSGRRDVSENTDSAGHFRIDGMPAGEYLLHAHLASQTVTLPVSGSGALGVYTHPGVEFDLYSGDAFWRRDAKPLNLARGEDASVDMVIPLAKLLTVSGSVVAGTDGHAVGLGSVTLAFRDDPGDVRSTEIEPDGHFRFLYVPEGDYVVKTEDAADGVAALTFDGGTPPTHESSLSHRYGEAKVVAHVADGSTTITLTVPERESRASQ